MLNQLRRWLSGIPIDDPVERQQGFLLQILLIGMLPALACSVLLNVLILSPGKPGPDGLLPGVALATGVVGALLLLRRGRLGPAVGFIIATMLLVQLYALLYNGLQRNAGLLLVYVIPIALAGLLSHRRALLLTLGLSILTPAVIAALEYSRGLRTPPGAPPIASTLVLFSLVMILLSLFLERLNGSLRRALGEAILLAAENARLLRDASEQRAHLDTILHAVADGVTVQDSRGRLIYANDAAARLIGLPSTEAMLKARADDLLRGGELFDEHGAPLPLERLPGGLVLADQPAPATLVRFRPQAGAEERWLIVRATPLRDAEGQVQYAVSSFQDVTPLKQAEMALFAERERLQVTLASIGDAVIATDTAGRVTYMNPVAERLTGWPQAEALGQPLGQVFAIVDEESRAPAESPVQRALEAGTVVGLTGHTLLLARDGHALPIDDSAAPIYADGQPIGVVLAFRDITARRRAEQERARLYHEAQAAIATRDKFLSIASHELKTPMTAMIGYAQLLQRRQGETPTLSERDQRSLAAVVAQAQRLGSLINLLLDLSRIELGQLAIERARMDLRPLVRRVVEDTQSSLERHHLSYSEPAEPLVVDGDALRLEQVLQNLLQNAVKYSPAGGEVRVELSHEESTAVLTISDQGIGIPAEALPQLFSRFYRAPNVELLRISGTGIGLYVVKEIIAQHQGSVEVESVEGQGSTFTVRMPLAP